MLLHFFPNISTNRFVQLFTKFINSWLYVIFVGLICTISEVFALEIPVYFTVAVISVILPSLFCKDMRSVIAPVTMFYCSLSIQHNNSYGNYNAFRDSKSFLISFIVCASLIAVTLITRLVFTFAVEKKKFRMPKLTLGFICLSIVFIFGGLGTQYFKWNTLLIGLLEAVCICITYFYLYFSVDWKEVKKDYVFFVLLVLGFVMLVQVCASFFITKDIAALDGRNKISTGWGMRTNIGGISCLTVVAPFYFIAKNKKVILNAICVALFTATTFLTQSRGPILTTIILLILCLVYSFIKISSKSRIKLLITLLFCAAIGFRSISIVESIYPEVFSYLKNSFDDFDIVRYSNGRLQTYWKGLQLFAKYPVMGTGWFTADTYKVTFLFFPSRWHNTIIQMLATAGSVGLIAYGFHRYQTIRLIFKKKQKVNLGDGFIGLVLLGFLFSSLLDCFFVNLGPGLIYGVLLVFLEQAIPDESNFFKNKKRTA